MNPEWKEPWVTALRSGEYPQGHAMLKSEEGFCCLGVLAHIAADALRAEDWVVDEGAEHITVEAKGTPPPEISQMLLPPPMQEYFGLSSEEMFVLTSMNDDGFNDFTAIAAYIETKL